MKRNLRLFAVSLTIAIIFSAFASCSCGESFNEKNAIEKLDEFKKTSEKYYKNGKIQETTHEIEISGTAYEIPVHTMQESTGKLTYIDSDTEDMTYIEELNIKITDFEPATAGDGETVVSFEEYSTINGYIDQNIIYSYIPSKTDANNIALNKKSQCTEEEYKELLKIGESLSSQIKTEHIEEININKDSSENIWNISISELNSKGNRELQNWIDYSMMTSGFSFKLFNVEAKFEIDAKTNAIRSSHTYIKAKSTTEDLTLTIKTNDTYSLPAQDHNIVINTDGYQDNADLKAFMYAEYGLVKLMMLNSDSRFDFSVASIITQGSKTISNSRENDSVKIEFYNNKLSYNIESELTYNDTPARFTISYDGKKQTMESEGAAPEVNPQTNDEAKLYLATSFFKLFIYDPSVIKNITTQTKNNNTVVSLNIVNSPILQQVLASLGITNPETSKEHYTIDITISNETNQLISVSTAITAYMTVQSSKISVIIDSSLIINTDNTAETI